MTGSEMGADAGVRVSMRGRDDLAIWNGYLGTCPYCLRANQACLRYVQVPGIKIYHEMSWDEIRAATILPEDKIGITCGCYAKFMRQLAHVVDNWAK